MKLTPLIEAAQAVLAAKAPLYTKESFDDGAIIVYLYAPPVDELLAEIRRTGPAKFDWMAWGDDAEAYADSPALLANADAEVVGRLLTIHFRNESLEPGHVAKQIDSGHLRHLLARLVEVAQRED